MEELCGARAGAAPLPMGARILPLPPPDKSNRLRVREPIPARSPSGSSCADRSLKIAARGSRRAGSGRGFSAGSRRPHPASGPSQAFDRTPLPGRHTRESSLNHLGLDGESAHRSQIVGEPVLFRLRFVSCMVAIDPNAFGCSVSERRYSSSSRSRQGRACTPSISARVRTPSRGGWCARKARTSERGRCFRAAAARR